jgi:hypothetical protein
MKYCKEKIEELCNYIKSGLSQRDASSLAGIDEDSFCLWKKKHSEFSEALKKAELKNKQRALILIQKAGESSWQAMAWYLERKYKDEFSLMQKIEHTGDITIRFDKQDKGL